MLALTDGITVLGLGRRIAIRVLVRVLVSGSEPVEEWRLAIRVP
jgi:hypothetical protein